MESGKKGRGLLQCSNLRVKPRGGGAPPEERHYFGFCAQGGMGGVEDQKMIGGLTRPGWPRVANIIRVGVRIALGGLCVCAGDPKAAEPGASVIETERYTLSRCLAGARAA